MFGSTLSSRESRTTAQFVEAVGGGGGGGRSSTSEVLKEANGQSAVKMVEKHVAPAGYLLSFFVARSLSASWTIGETVTSKILCNWPICKNRIKLNAALDPCS